MLSSSLLATAAAARPAGGAAIGQVVIATSFASAATVGLLWLLQTYRSGRNRVLARASEFSERVSGLPGWAALPAGVAGGALLVALLGMYWDISLHIDNGRDPGPLANPAHYLILLGLYGVFASGCLAIALPKERPGPAAIRIQRDWYAPVGGVLIAACGAFALIGFPLDDMWHRLFGQDVTLWGPTHLMLFGGASMTLIGQAVLLQEGMRARRAAGAEGQLPFVTALRRVGLMGGLLIGLSTFQGEFDFGVPQFRFVFHPLLIALAAALALVAARIWIGRGGALGAAAMFLGVRGFISLLVGPVFGETTPALPLYLPEALCIELLAFALVRRPLAFGAAGGLLAGTVGFAAEWPWTHLVFKLPWNASLLPEGLIVAAVAGVAGGVIGALLGLGLRGELPRPTLARGVLVAAGVAIAAVVANGLVTEKPSGERAAISLADARGGSAVVNARVSPASAAGDAAWVTVTAWQGRGKLIVDRLENAGGGLYRGTQRIPLHGDWKATLRLQDGRKVIAAPVSMPGDPAIPAKEIPARAHVTRPFVLDRELLQRERKQDVPTWLWTAACLVVGVLFLGFLSALAWGVARVARRDPRAPARREGRFTRRPGTVAPTVGASA
jgi:hypothetical protein